jgi:hypothetical protein
MKLLFLTLIIANLAFAQKYVVFENNKKNKALFDYNDPNSLVSMLVQSRDKIIANDTRDGIITSGVNEEYTLHPIDGMPYFSYPGEDWPFQLADGFDWPLRKTNMNESARDMLNRLKSQGEPDFGLEPAQYTDAVDLFLTDPELFAKFEVQYVKSTWNVKLPDQIVHYDVNQIDLIVVDSIKIYFARKSPYENKHFICLTLKLDELKELERLDYLNESLSKTITSKLREYQLKKKELETAEGPKFNLIEYDAYRQGSLFNTYNEDEFKVYQKTSCIKNIYPGHSWPFQLADGTVWPLRKTNMNESARDMLNRLKSQGEPDFGLEPAQYTFADILLADPDLFAKFEAQYVKCGEKQEVKQPDFEAIYWVDYPDPAVYLKRSFSKDTLGKFKTSFSQLLFTERLNNKKGFDQKPQVLMSFGSSYEYYENPISQEILDLLKVELAPFSLNKELSWQQLISNRKGNKISNEDLKKLIHCTDINENGIEY